MEPLHADDEFVRSHSRLVHHVAKRYKWALRSSSLDYSDLVGEGTVGLLKAYRNFDVSKGFEFSTYAVPMIRWEIQRYLRDKGGQLIRAPRDLYELGGKIIRENLKYSTPEEVSAELGCSHQKAREALDYIHMNVDSIDRPLLGLDNDKVVVQDLIPVEDDRSGVEISDFIQSLTEREQEFLRLRLSGTTQHEIGKVLGCSQVQAGRMQVKIGEKYKRFMGVETLSEPSKPPTKTLTKAEYLKLKEQDKSDPEIRTLYALTDSALSRLKKEWGVVGMRKAVPQKSKREEVDPESMPGQLPTLVDPPTLVPRQIQYDPGSNPELERRLERAERENGLLKALLKLYL